MTDTSLPPCLGLIVPPAHGRVPVDAELLYGTRYHFLARGLGLPSVSTEGYAQVIDSVLAHALALREAGAQAVSLMGTSLSFYRGADFTEELRAQMQAHTGLPCTTMSHAIVRSLRAQGVQRVAVATSYIEEVNDKLQQFLEDQGFAVQSLVGLGISGVEAMEAVPTDTLVTLSEQALARASGPVDGVLISCGGLRTLDAIALLEQRHGLPVVSSSPAGFHDLLCTAGLDARSERGGRLFQGSGTRPPGI